MKVPVLPIPALKINKQKNKFYYLSTLTLLNRVATFESIQNSLTFPWQNNNFPWQFLLFFNLWKNNFQLLLMAILKGKSLAVIISRSWVYICQADIYINTTQVQPLSHDGRFNPKIMSWQNSLTIPWIDITKFPDMGQMAKIPRHFFKIPWLFPNLEKILFFPDISLTRGNPVDDSAKSRLLIELGISSVFSALFIRIYEPGRARLARHNFLRARLHLATATRLRLRCDIAPKSNLVFWCCTVTYSVCDCDCH